jgi:hypothetical protein
LSVQILIRALQLVVRFQARELGAQMKHRGRNSQQYQWQVVGLALQYMDLTEIHTLRRIMDLIADLEGGSEYASKILGANQ